MRNKVEDLLFLWEQQITINSGCLPMFAPITFKKRKTDRTNNGITPLTTSTNQNTVQKSVLVHMQNNFMENPYEVDNTHRALTNNDQMILLLGVQVR